MNNTVNTRIQTLFLMLDRIRVELNQRQGILLSSLIASGGDPLCIYGICELDPPYQKLKEEELSLSICYQSLKEIYEIN